MKTEIDMTGLTTKKFVANSRRGSDYKSTIHNFSGQSVTVTVTNKDIQAAVAPGDFDTPAAGALVVVDGAIGSLNEPYDGWLLTLGLAGTGSIFVTEAG